MKVLAVETSCDETAAAVLSSDAGGPQILSERVSSQVELHQLYGGVVPELASREHLRNIPLVVDAVLEDARITLRECDALLFTRGPGLKGCLLIGASFVKGLACALGKPCLGVNHIEGHLLAPMLDCPELQPPYLALVVSGGHTEIIHVAGVGDYHLCTRTRDDAAGEAFDKSANLLGLAYPGGARLAAIADTVTQSDIELPRLSAEVKDFSFSGLKTAISLAVQREKKQGALTEVRLAALAHAIQDTIVSTLVERLRREARQRGISSVAVTGGVAANRELRRRVAALPGLRSFFPTMQHCGDNAAMIAYAGWWRLKAGHADRPGVGVLSRWPIEETNFASGSIPV